MKNVLQLLSTSLLILLVAPITLLAQKTLETPIVSQTNSEYVSIAKIEQAGDSTVFQMELSCYEGLEYTLHEKGSIHAYKMIAGAKEYELRSISVGKPGVVQCQMMSIEYFHLVFDALPEDIDVVSLQEGDASDTDLYFKDILLVDLASAKAKAKEGNTAYQQFLAKHFENQYDYEMAQEYLNMYLDYVVAEKGTQSEEYLDALSSQIQLNLNRGNYVEAEELSLQTIEAVGLDNPDVAGILYTLGDVYQVLGKHEDAVSNYIQYLRTMEKGTKLKSATYSMVNNLVMYSWASMKDTLDRRPMTVGVAINPNKTEEGTAQMRIYAVGATEYMVSDNEGFKNSEWQVYEPAMLDEKSIKRKSKALYIRFKDNKDRLSDTFVVNLE